MEYLHLTKPNTSNLGAFRSQNSIFKVIAYAENLKDIDNLVSIDRNIWHLFTYVIEGQQTSFYVNGNLITVSNEASDLGSVSLTWGN